MVTGLVINGTCVRTQDQDRKIRAGRAAKQKGTKGRTSSEAWDSTLGCCDVSSR